MLTVCAVLFGLGTQVIFRARSWSNFFGPDFYIYVYAVGSAYVSGILLPILAIPIIMLRDATSRRFGRIAVAFWLLMTTFGVAIVAATEEEELSTVLGHILLMQLSAMLVSVLVALPMRRAGFRLLAVAQPQRLVDMALGIR